MFKLSYSYIKHGSGWSFKVHFVSLGLTDHYPEINTRHACEQVVLAPLDPLLATRVDLHAAGLALHRLATLVPLPPHLAEHDVAAVPRLPQSAFVFSVQQDFTIKFHVL